MIGREVSFPYSICRYVCILVPAQPSGERGGHPNERRAAAGAGPSHTASAAKARVGRSPRLHPLRASGRTSGAGGSAAGLGRPTSSSAPVKAISGYGQLEAEGGTLVLHFVSWFPVGLRCMRQRAHLSVTDKRGKKGYGCTWRGVEPGGDVERRNQGSI